MTTHRKRVCRGNALHQGEGGGGVAKAGKQGNASQGDETFGGRALCSHTVAPNLYNW